MSYASIVGLGTYLPERILTNEDMKQFVETSHEWIVERTGICERHVAAEDDTVASMGEIAARKALEEANMAADELDLIIMATCTPEYFFPSTACFLQKRLGATNAAAFDISAACSGFIYALTTAQQYIKNGVAKKILIVGSEVLSRAVDMHDRTTSILFGDGAGAVVLEATETPGILATKIYSDGCQSDILRFPTAIGKAERPKISMQGKEVFRFAVERLTNAVIDILKLANMSIDNVDWVIPHQANLRIINMVASKLQIPTEKVIVTVDKHANTSSASIPLALDNAVKSGKIKRGDTMIFEAFGGGLTWGSVLLKY